MLAAHLEEMDRAEAREIYIGNALWALLQATTKAGERIPSLSELMHEDRVRDDRTGREIVADVLAMLEN